MGKNISSRKFFVRLWLLFCALLPFSVVVGVAVASYLVRLSPGQVVLVQALVGDIALCS